MLGYPSLEMLRICTDKALSKVTRYEVGAEAAEVPSCQGLSVAKWCWGGFPCTPGICFAKAACRDGCGVCFMGL